MGGGGGGEEGVSSKNENGGVKWFEEKGLLSTLFHLTGVCLSRKYVLGMYIFA